MKENPNNEIRDGKEMKENQRSLGLELSRENERDGEGKMAKEEKWD